MARHPYPPLDNLPPRLKEELAKRVTALRLVPDSVEEMPNAFVYGLRSARMELDFATV